MRNSRSPNNTTLNTDSYEEFTANAITHGSVRLAKNV